jgi:hypothetical protein
MSLLRILRNFAVLVIFTVAGFSLMPRPVAASTCVPLGHHCTKQQCCAGLCSSLLHYCCIPFPGESCTGPGQCCSGGCFAGRCA